MPYLRGRVDQMGDYNNLIKYGHEQQRKKALRLARGKPKWKDEKLMKKEEYEAYIDSFLKNGEKDTDKVKIAVAMYDKKCKYDKDEVNILDSAE